MGTTTRPMASTESALRLRGRCDEVSKQVEVVKKHRIRMQKEDRATAVGFRGLAEGSRRKHPRAGAFKVSQPGEVEADRTGLRERFPADPFHPCRQSTLPRLIAGRTWPMP